MDDALHKDLISACGLLGVSMMTLALALRPELVPLHRRRAPVFEAAAEGAQILLRPGSSFLWSLLGGGLVLAIVGASLFIYETFFK
jgi:hypothetical protein